MVCPAWRHVFADGSVSAEGPPADALPLSPVSSADADTIVDVAGASFSGLLKVAALPNWVFMDISMAPIDGITATRRITQTFSAARIVIVTQYDDVHFRAAAHAAGACGYVRKDNLFEVRRFFHPTA